MSQPTFHPDLNYFCADTEAEIQHSGYQSITRQVWFLALKTKETFSVGHAIVMQKVNFYVVKGYLLQAKR